MNDTQFEQSSVTIKKGESITLVSTTFTPHIIANGTWDNGQARPTNEPGSPPVKNVQINGNSSSTTSALLRRLAPSNSIVLFIAV